MKAKNESEFLALKLRYETITIEEIEREWVFCDNAEETMNKITGFASSDCTLCKACSRDCKDCVYGLVFKKDLSCYRMDEGSTMNRISYSIDETELIEACRNRAIHMGKVWEKYVKQV